MLSIPILGFAAASGTGKTTLLTQILPLLKNTGLRVGLIKHSHHDFEIDHVGKDSFELRKAGATPVVLVSKYRRAVIEEFEYQIEPNLTEQIALFNPEKIDLILVEGFRSQAFAKIELHRAELNKPLLYQNDAHIIAVATDTRLDTNLPQLNLNSPTEIANFILHHFFKMMTLESCVTIEKKPLLTVEQAQQRIDNAISSLTETELVPLKNAFGRVLAKTICSPINLPTARNSAMDGYAFASEFFAEKLTCVGTSWAGKPFAGEMKKGECVRIFTGAVLPENADSVVMQEHVTVEGLQVIFPTDVKLKKNVREIGEDVKTGDILCNAGRILSAIDLGLLASAGIENVLIIRKVKIAYFSTGDELVGLDETLEIGKIYDSNRYSLHGLLQNSYYEITDGGVIADDKEILKNTLLEAAKKFDVILTTGGASVGEADFVKEVLDELGEVNFWKVAMKPGKPLAFGKIGGCYFFGLPGNPVAVTTTFDVIVKPALAKLSGTEFKKPFKIKAICESKLKKSRGRQEYQRGMLQQDETGCFHVFSTGNQGSHILSTASIANCYIVLPADCEGVQMGETVTIILFSS